MSVDCCWKLDVDLPTTLRLASFLFSRAADELDLNVYGGADVYAHFMPQFCAAAAAAATAAVVRKANAESCIIRLGDRAPLPLN